MYHKINLSGSWRLQPGNNKPASFEYSVPVPAMVDNCLPGLVWQGYDYFWYKKEIHFPASQKYKKAFLQLEQVQFGADVWLNGKRVGGDIPCYTSQWYDVTGFLQAGKNILLVRVGQKHTLPEHSAVGNDQERLSWIPGIWGDVSLHLYGSGRVRWMRIQPDIDAERLDILFELENFSDTLQSFMLEWQVVEKRSRAKLTSVFHQKISIAAHSIKEWPKETAVADYKLWLPESPNLYAVVFKLMDEDGRIVHDGETHFGFRKFEIRGRHFYLNNQRRVLLGSNIAFHRLLSDSTRGTLLWDEEWIKKAFIRIPKENNLTFFRFHLGHAYNRWYDFADEYGIALEDEWAFWTSSGSAEQIEKEFTSWIRENINRPSILIWSALNESRDSRITDELIPKLKKIDPTRPWQHVDFGEDHPYIYSLGPVLNREKFGFSRSLSEMQNNTSPVMANEFEWWWPDRNNNPSALTEIVVERWLGRKWTKAELIKHQTFLAAELGELWRRLDLDAIMPFVYLSVGEGPTADWFDGTLENLKPKPVLAAYKNALAPLGVSIELWDRHFYTGEQRTINIYVFNDRAKNADVRLRVSIAGQLLSEQKLTLSAGQHRVVPLEWEVSGMGMAAEMTAEVSDGQNKMSAFSRKPCFVFEETPALSTDDFPRLILADSSAEVETFLKRRQIPFSSWPCVLTNTDRLFINQGSLKDISNTGRRELSRFVTSGGILILQEPEFGIVNESHLRVLDDLKLKIVRRQDAAMGGYDSYVFMEDPRRRLWRGIEPRHLKLFNGALGGEIVSQHDVTPNRDYKALARCGLSLSTAAVIEIPYGRGKVVISRIQVRGRLLKEHKGPGLYERRYDPVAECYLLNLILAG